jgi:hypothetical protein
VAEVSSEEAIEDEERDDEIRLTSPFEVLDEPIEAPCAWEDVQDALETLEEDDLR